MRLEELDDAPAIQQVESPWLRGGRKGPQTPQTKPRSIERSQIYACLASPERRETLQETNISCVLPGPDGRAQQHWVDAHLMEKPHRAIPANWPSTSVAILPVWVANSQLA